MTDADFMRIAIETSKQGDYPYGAVLVKTGEIIATAGNTCARDNDPTAHAEMNVIRQAAKLLPGGLFIGCTLYSSSEPCPMCAGAIVWAGVSRLVFGASIEQLVSVGQRQIQTSSVSIVQSSADDIEVLGGILSNLALDEFHETPP